MILNLETATTNCSVGLAKNGILLALKEHDSVNFSHSEQLHNFIVEVLDQASVALSAIDAIAVSKGPGSYTGLRIGVSAAKGLCFSLDIPLIAVSTLESMAHQVQVGANEVIVPVLDARRMEVYAAVFDARYNLIRETQAEIIEAHSFTDYIYESRAHIVGSGAQKCLGLLDHPNFEFYTSVLPSAREMAGLSYKEYLDSNFENLAYFEPYYLKDFMVHQKK